MGFVKKIYIKIYKYYLLYLFAKKYSFSIKGSQVFTSGISFTILTEDFIIKVPNIKRLKYVIEEHKLSNCIWCIQIDNLSRLHREAELFRKVNRRNSYVKNGTLFIERIEAVSLDCFLHSDYFDRYLKNALLKLIFLKKEYDFSHADFHMKNILIDKEGNVYFVDFEYDYCKRYKNYSLELDVVYFFNNMLFYYRDYFVEHREKMLIILENIGFDKERLLEAIELLRYYIAKDNIESLRGFFNDL